MATGGAGRGMVGVLDRVSHSPLFASFQMAKDGAPARDSRTRRRRWRRRAIPRSVGVRYPRPTRNESHRRRGDSDTTKSTTSRCRHIKCHHHHRRSSLAICSFATHRCVPGGAGFGVQIWPVVGFVVEEARTIAGRWWEGRPPAGSGAHPEEALHLGASAIGRFGGHVE